MLGRMALLFPIPGVSGQLFAADRAMAWDATALKLLKATLVINLTTRPTPGRPAAPWGINIISS